jgi:hypothetical protein
MDPSGHTSDGLPSRSPLCVEGEAAPVRSQSAAAFWHPVCKSAVECAARGELLIRPQASRARAPAYGLRPCGAICIVNVLAICVVNALVARSTIFGHVGVRASLSPDCRQPQRQNNEPGNSLAFRSIRFRIVQYRHRLGVTRMCRRVLLHA